MSKITWKEANESITFEGIGQCLEEKLKIKHPVANVVATIFVAPALVATTGAGRLIEKMKKPKKNVDTI